MLKNAIKIVLGVKNCIPKIWRFFWKKLCTFLVAYVRKNVGKNRAKRFLENSSFLVRVAIYFLIPHEEFKTEKILHPILVVLHFSAIKVQVILMHVISH